MRRLNPDERALWTRLTSTVRPMLPVAEARLAPAVLQKVAVPAAPTPAKPAAPARPIVRAGPPPANTLDGGWDKRLTRGTVQPTMTVDLHGHTLSSAWHRLDDALEQAVRGGHRVLLLVTGKARRDDSGRGAIARAVPDWLAASRHAGDIAAVRNAHPRHGGSGALYVILRRAR